MSTLPVNLKLCIMYLVIKRSISSLKAICTKKNQKFRVFQIDFATFSNQNTIINLKNPDMLKVLN